MKYIPNGVTRTVGRAILQTRKHSPQILFVGGIVGVGASTVMACRATLKLSDQLDKMKSEMSDVKQLADSDSNSTDGRDVAKVYVKNAARVARLYAPAAIVGVASVGALTGSHVTLTRRNAGLTAAYATVVKAYDDYRERVKEELGEEKELDIYQGARIDKIKDENGKIVQIRSIDPNAISQYAKFFDDDNVNWQKHPEYNRLWLQVNQTYFNELLRARGHVFLNEVYDKLGFEHSKAGAVVGWVLNEKGDNYVDFGLFSDVNARFVNGMERTALLDFNVDGVIYDKI